MKLTKISILMIIVCVTILFINKLCFNSVKNNDSENLEKQEKSTQNYIWGSREQPQIKNTVDHLSTESPDNNISDTYSFQTEQTEDKFIRQSEGKNIQEFIPIKKTDSNTLKKAGITYKSILEKHSNMPNPELKQLTSGYDIPDDKWEDMIALYTNIKDPSNDQEISIKANSLLDMAATKMMIKDYEKAKQALEAIIDYFPGTEAEQKAIKGMERCN